MKNSGRRSSRGRSWRLIGLAGIAAVLGGVMFARPELIPLPRGASVAAPAAPAPPPALAVAVTPVERHPLWRTVSGDGSVVAWQELVIGSEIGGLRVAEVAVEPGDLVRQGQLLVRLDDAVLAAQLAQSEAAVTEAEAALHIARQDLERSVELSRSQNVARQILEQRQAAALQAEARLEAARARRGEAAARLAQARILAPDDGIISRRVALLGSVVQAGQEMVRLIRDGRLELDARVPELELPAVHPGQSVRVLHGDRVIEATVRDVAPTVTPETRLGTVHVSLPPGSGLRPGMFARAEILAEVTPSLAVPQQAIVFRDGRPAVFVLPPGADAVELRPVRTGRRNGGTVEVSEGLAEGERVVVTGAGFLSDGDRVRVVQGMAEAR